MTQVLTFQVPEQIAFHHSFFSTFSDAQFRIGEADQVPVITFEMGNQTTALPLAGVKREFQIPEFSDDGVMLNTVIRSLDFVNILRIGDDIPGEIVTGDASWLPAPADHAAATQRLTAELVGWNLDIDVPRSDPVLLREFATEYVNDETIRYALLRLAAHFGFGADGATRLTKTMNNIAEELAYIEALRSRFAEVISLATKLVGMRRDFRHHASVIATLDPVVRMVKEPIRVFRQHLGEVDQQVAAIVTMFGDFPSVRDILRTARDSLFQRLVPWKPITESWARLVVTELDPFEVVPHLRDLFRFLASRFMPVDEWELILSGNGKDIGALAQGAVVTWFERESQVA